jgi:colanic acid/amylovoran biosynthesis protein
VLHKAGREHQAELIAVPISSAPHESDISHIRRVLDRYDRVFIDWRKLDTPMAAIKKVGRCRLMVAGTYHGAIFSLAQGIPVVGVARSSEYFDKLAELSDEFGAGCRVLSLDDEQFENQFAEALDEIWYSAEALRPLLFDSAIRQIDLQRDAYQRIFELVEIRNAVRSSISMVKS